ncbi:MAG: PaaI family thioesterase [Marmoricola sp.]
MDAPFQYPVVDLTDEEVATEREVFGGLADSVRALAEASLRTTVDPEVAADVRRDVDALTARLTKSRIDGSFGVQLTRSGHVRGHGNAVVGLRNPVAVPLRIEHSKEGRAWSSFELNALYEGPPGMVHGGVAALVLDQVFGEAAAAGGTPGMTGTLSLRYRRNTPLGTCSAEAWVDRRDGVKTMVKGELRRADGETTVEAEGIFILPRWAREAMDRHRNRTPPQFE